MAKKVITYLVKHRMDLGFIVPAGVLVRGSDIPDVPVLMERGFLLPVPDDYPAELFTPPAETAEPEESTSPAQPPKPNVPEGVDPTTSQLPPADFIPASTPGVDLPPVVDLSGAEA